MKEDIIRPPVLLRAAIAAIVLLTAFTLDLPGESGLSLSPHGTTTAQTAGPSSPAKVIVMGDSLSIGCCAPIDETWPSLLTKRLGAELENLAQGTTTSESLISMDRTFPSGRTQSQLDEALSLIVESDNVAAVTLAVGIIEFLLVDPDTGVNCFVAGTSACEELFQAASENLQANLHFIVGELHAAMDPGTPLLMMNYYFGSDWKLNTIILSESQEHGAMFVNLAEYFRNRHSELQIDWIHKNELGHRVIADLLTNAVPPDSDGDGLSDLMEGILNSDPAMTDSDGDDCLDGVEFGPQRSAGGRRDPMNFWDFFDTPDINNVRDKAITISDIGRIVARFGTFGDPAIDPLSQPLPSGYHTAFDRTPLGPNVWNLGAPNGSVMIQDIGLSVAQFGHSCAGTP